MDKIVRFQSIRIARNPFLIGAKCGIRSGTQKFFKCLVNRSSSLKIIENTSEKESIGKDTESTKLTKNYKIIPNRHEKDRSKRINISVRF